MQQGTTDPLDGVRVIEGATFVAAPSGGMALAQLGAEVIRVDPPRGGSDYRRWPIDNRGTSLFWANLNKGKKSVTIDYRRPAGRELLLELVAALGADSGIFLDNMVGSARLTYDEIAARRPDVIHVHIEGHADGRPAVDYTVNAEVGIPDITGPEGLGVPVNQVLPAWDLLTGMTAASAVLAGLLKRGRSGGGSRIELALSDVAMSAVGGLGWLAEAHLAGSDRLRQGNHIYGSFGVDFATSDDHHVMVVALTEAQWTALCRVTGTAPIFDVLAESLSADLNSESDRYRLRETIAAILRPWFAQRSLAQVSSELREARVLWGPYRSMTEAVALARQDETSVAHEIDQPGVGRMLATSGPLRWDGERHPPLPAPLLGADTDRVLADVLGLTTAEIGRLHHDGIAQVAIDDARTSA